MKTVLCYHKGVTSSFRRRSGTTLAPRESSGFSWPIFEGSESFLRLKRSSWAPRIGPSAAELERRPAAPLADVFCSSRGPAAVDLRICGGFPFVSPLASMTVHSKIFPATPPSGEIDKIPSFAMLRAVICVRAFRTRGVPGEHSRALRENRLYGGGTL